MVLDRIRELVEKITLETGVDLYDLELKNTDKGKVLRVFITRKGGVTLSDCSRVSRMMSRELDVIDLIESQYFLEVSSPGLERALKREEQYRQAVNEQVKVTYREDEKNVTMTGLLKEVTSDGITIAQNREGKEEEQTLQNIPFTAIKKARTVYVFQANKGVK